MLREENRLKKMRDFGSVMKRGWYYKAAYIDAKILRLETVKDALSHDHKLTDFENELKVAFTVGLKISKKAVIRNRLRRQMREVVRLLIKNNNLKNGFFILFIAKKGIIEQDYSGIKKDIVQLLEIGKVINTSKLF